MAAGGETIRATVVVRFLVCIIQAMRIETGHRLARALAWLAADVLKIRGRVVDDNLLHAFPELSAADRQTLARQMWEHLLVMVLEICPRPAQDPRDQLGATMCVLHGEAPLLRLLLEDRPTLVTTAHFGNFEAAGYVLGLLGFKSHTVARKLDNPYLDRYVKQFPQRHGGSTSSRRTAATIRSCGCWPTAAS